MSMLLNENQQFDMSKSNFITTAYNSQNSNYQPIIQNIQSFNKEIISVSPMLKLETNMDGSKSLRNDQGQESQIISPNLKVETIPIKKSRGHIDRYNGLSEEEVIQRTLPDYLKENLDLIVVGINPSMTSACVGHHYAGIGNHFWTCIAEAGLVPETVTCYDDYRMVDYGIGFTNVCSRPTKGAAEISRKEMKAGALVMLEKMRKYKPKIAVFNGKGIYEAFIGHKNFYMGKQPKPLDGTDIIVFVMPSSSARCAQLPRAEDKLPFFIALRKLRDYVNGELTFLSDQEVIFSDYTEFRVTQPDPKSLRKAERRRKRKAEQMLGSNCSSDMLVSFSGKSRKNKTIYSTERQMIKSETHLGSIMTGGNKDSIDLNLSSADLTPVTITDESVPQMDMPIALYNQSTGVISIVPSCDMFGTTNTFAIANGSPVLMLPSNASSTAASNSSINTNTNNNNNNNSNGNNNNNNNKSASIIQNKNVSQVMTKPLLLQQDASGQTYILASPSQFLQTSNQMQSTQTATLVPIGTSNGNTTMALLQPGQLLTASGQVIDTGTATLSWAPQNQIQTQQQTQQQQQQQTQFISNGLVYQKAASVSNAPQQQQQTQQFICTAATLQQLLQQQQQPQFQIINQLGYPQQFAIQTPLGLANGIQIQPISNCISESMSTTDSMHTQDQMSNNGGPNQNGQRTSSREPGNQSSSQSMILVSANSNQQSSISGTVGSQSQFAYMTPSSQHIVIPISGGGLLQLTEPQKLACLGQQPQIVHLQQQQHQQHQQHQQQQQQQRSRPMTSSSSTSGISSVAGQGDIDLLSTSSGVMDSSQLYQQCTSAAPVQLADCEDQLVQCSSSDEKLLYSAL